MYVCRFNGHYVKLYMRTNVPAISKHHGLIFLLITARYIYKISISTHNLLVGIYMYIA